MADKVLDNEALTKHLRDAFVRIATLEKELKATKEKLDSGGPAVSTGDFKRMVKAKHSDFIKVDPKSESRWFGMEVGIEVDADISAEEYTATAEKMQKQAEYFVAKWLKEWAKEWKKKQAAKAEKE